jgi:S-adenosylmethionine decarboxylase
MFQDALFQLGMDLDPVSSTAQEEVKLCSVGRTCDSESPKDYFIERDGKVFAGTHLIIDVLDGERLDDLAHVEKALIGCVEAAGATLLHIHLHHFTPNGGISGVAILAESHISIHTWPERGYAALDVFMCGAARPHQAIGVLEEAFRPRSLRVAEHLRGEGL